MAIVAQDMAQAVPKDFGPPVYAHRTIEKVFLALEHSFQRRLNRIPTIRGIDLCLLSIIVVKQMCWAVSIAASVALTVPSISSTDEDSCAERARGSGATHRVYLRSEAAQARKGAALRCPSHATRSELDIETEIKQSLNYKHTQAVGKCKQTFSC
ncbi:hypothetical protein HNY73_003960 [Argiope bruennichi]|uniref:Uncharacterized protein n=1 Tax=Argiope bruennichi TaxID=94029 RepID=A0A8T0FMD9_ARGBR|nr:hypothetical protein HNY73_003960 [Argiope bruennichi]